MDVQVIQIPILMTAEVKKMKEKKRKSQYVGHFGKEKNIKIVFSVEPGQLDS